MSFNDKMSKLNYNLPIQEINFINEDKDKKISNEKL